MLSSIALLAVAASPLVEGNAVNWKQLYMYIGPIDTCVPAESPVAAAHRIRVYPRGYWINSGVYRGANAFEAINAGCYRMIAALILDADRIY